MNYRQLANTGVWLPVIGLGTWQYTADDEPLRAGIECGARFVDTAESYGSEPIVARALRGIRHDVFLATKVSPRHFRYADVLAAARASLKWLETDYIDLYQLHWPNYTVRLAETMGAMEKLADEGHIRFIGVSNFMLGDLKRAQRAMTKHRIVSNQVRYNLIDRTIEGGLLEYCREQGITVIAHSPLATGLRHIRAKDPKRILESVAERLGKSAAQVALAWCISDDNVVTIPKASTVAHVSENCAAAGVQLSLDQLTSLREGIRFRRRNLGEIVARRVARHALQVFGRNQ